MANLPQEFPALIPYQSVWFFQNAFNKYVSTILQFYLPLCSPSYDESTFTGHTQGIRKVSVQGHTTRNAGSS